MSETTRGIYDRYVYLRSEEIRVTCYFRHIKHIFTKAGIEVTKENKREIDRAIHNIVGVEYKNCSSTWGEVKKRLAEDEDAFISELQKTQRS